MGIPRKWEKNQATSFSKEAQMTGPVLHLSSSQTLEGKRPNSSCSHLTRPHGGRQEGHSREGLPPTAEVSFRGTQDPPPPQTSTGKHLPVQPLLCY